ncbi:outer membrane beta-barrel protein [Bradyrhizobium archetypum]|uniref:Outer membrane beta-barrel protein n=1 Tax=Bradyrhizobium archetypum TaxID=2721160 RepID=A0A7Y4H9X7_9BRAD|nr:outer membrane beta-barrel protein [Bradyrhizobium archetypum]NOJ50108.1 outer membrane beta-barrel protein [Bradyrhizobium archetypum]
MQSKLLFWAVATAALVASGAVNSADLRPLVRVPPALWSWTGGYIGGHVGGGYGRTSFSDPYGPSIYGDVVSTPVFLAGGQLGYNWQTNGWVFGVELDASHAVSDGTNTCLAFSGIVVTDTCTAGPNVFVTGTARVGYAFGPQGHTLAYVKAGVAWQNNRGDIANNNEFRHGNFVGFPRETTQFDYGRFGATIGAGVEQALTPAWTVKFEYDYMGFGGPRVATPPTMQLPPLAIIPANTSTLSSNYHVGKIGLNYHFGVDPRAPEGSDAPLYPERATAKEAPVAYTGDWSFEGGSRLWLSRGRFQWDYNVAPAIPGETGIPNSRLSYQWLDGVSGELFGRLDSPWGIFLKSNIGVGRFNKGKMNDEDSSFPIEDGVAYSNTLSGQANGRFMYYTADAGYDFLRGGTYKVGGFIGWSYYSQKSDSIGCVQTASPYYSCLAPGDKRIMGSQDTDWNAPRIGLSAETMLLERWRVSADVAYLPWTEFNGRDNHLLRHNTTFYEQRGDSGGGVQVEAILSYFITKNFTVGVGGRYWAMWTKKDSDVVYNCSGCEGPKILSQVPALAKYSMERWGTFFQASYKFD